VFYEADKHSKLYYLLCFIIIKYIAVVCSACYPTLPGTGRVVAM